MEKISIIGMGYVGTTLAVTLADVGFSVVGVEINPHVRNLLNSKAPHFHESGLKKLLEKHIGKRLVIVDKMNGDCSTYIICVTTPVDEHKKPLLNFVEHATKEIATCIKKGDLIILRSTVPVGTTRNFVVPIIEKESGLKCGSDFHVAFAPERTIEGKALEELRGLPQIVGGYDEDCSVRASNIFMKITPTIVNVSSLETAEIIKLLDNSYRDIRFAYANEIALICEHLNVNASEAIKAANMGYQRNNIPLPSPGVGGACLTKDPYILFDIAKKAGYDARLIRLGREINEYMPVHVVQKIRDYFKAIDKSIQSSKIFVIGFAFKGKPETSDTRESTTLPVVRDLLAVGAKVYGYDTVALESDIRASGAIPANLEEGFSEADCVVIMNNHESYMNINMDSLLGTTHKPCLFIDGWNMFKHKEITEKKDIFYGGVGCKLS